MNSSETRRGLTAVEAVDVAAAVAVLSTAVLVVVVEVVDGWMEEYR